jgi:hypothetical protein
MLTATPCQVLPDREGCRPPIQSGGDGVGQNINDLAGEVVP